MKSPESIPSDDYSMRLLSADLTEVRGNEVVFRHISDDFFADLDNAISKVNKITYGCYLKSVCLGPLTNKKNIKRQQESTMTEWLNSRGWYGVDVYSSSIPVRY